ncbi:MAG TPA: type II toxin-antitoxin system VapC family toxin [Pirellulaceae bacterium]|nr:type II toxin-antitoxin system VapC family toxin [Pirellulaceae bacterium]
MKFLVDTNICVFAIRGRSEIVVNRLESHSPDDVVVSAITVAELRYGAMRSKDPGRNMAALDAFLQPFQFLPFAEDATAAYGTIRAELQSKGTPIGALDMLIAAQAVALGLTVVTNNVREFSRVPGLAVEDWTVP